MPNLVSLAFVIAKICVFIQTKKQYTFLSTIFLGYKKTRQVQKFLVARKRGDYGEFESVGPHSGFAGAVLMFERFAL